jgi:hypothetical protein
MVMMRVYLLGGALPTATIAAIGDGHHLLLNCNCIKINLPAALSVRRLHRAILNRFQAFTPDNKFEAGKCRTTIERSIRNSNISG